MSPFARLALAAGALLLSVFPVAAVQPMGSGAWTDDGGWVNTASELFHGPGPQYGEIGTVGGGLRVRVDRCSGLWCQIHAKNLSGWMRLGDLSFGQFPAGSPESRAVYPIRFGGPVCFYSGSNFTGEQTCYSQGAVTRDLLLAGRDNSFASVKVNGGSVLACRDRFFRSYCVILNKDERHLEPLLSRSISSIEVY
ncbi:MAG TPA: hypothetical protein VHZ56_07650 [Devosia sp.]|nr:hypothetical protein [Devosia sp.]